MIMMWHGVKVKYGPLGGDTYCGWVSVGSRSVGLDIPWPPPLPDGHTCNHKVCNSLPAMSDTMVRQMFEKFLRDIGVQSGEYTLVGRVQLRPDRATTGCVLHHTINIK